MDELIAYILCSIGIIYLFWRIAIFLKTLTRLIGRSRGSLNGLTKDKISKLCHCKFTVFNNS